MPDMQSCRAAVCKTSALLSVSPRFGNSLDRAANNAGDKGYHISARCAVQCILALFKESASDKSYAPDDNIAVLIMRRACTGKDSGRAAHSDARSALIQNGEFWAVVQETAKAEALLLPQAELGAPVQAVAQAARQICQILQIDLPQQVPQLILGDNIALSLCTWPGQSSTLQHGKGDLSADACVQADKRSAKFLQQRQRR